jgi:hypothetical protein
MRWCGAFFFIEDITIGRADQDFVTPTMGIYESGFA